MEEEALPAPLPPEALDQDEAPWLEVPDTEGNAEESDALADDGEADDAADDDSAESSPGSEREVLPGGEPQDDEDERTSGEGVSDEGP